MKYVSFETIHGWCAGCKIAGVTDQTIGLKDFPSLDKIVEAVAHDFERSCVVVSTTVDEVKANAWLEKHGFEKGPDIQNWNHEGRLTNLWFYQIPQSDMPKEYQDEEEEDEEDD